MGKILCSVANQFITEKFMSTSGHPNEKINTFIHNNIATIDGFNLVSCVSKETIVLEEKEVTWVYTFNSGKSATNMTITISDPLYFCDVSFSKGDKVHFPLKAYMEDINQDKSLEALFNQFIDEEITEQIYILGYLNIFAQEAKTQAVLDIMDGLYWPEIIDVDFD
jgi:hypothetical protein